MQKASILIVDDEPIVCNVLSEIVRMAGHKPIIAKDGREALEIIKKEFPPIIIIDLNIPVINGMEVLKQTQAIIPGTAIIVVTGYATMDLLSEAMKNGAFDFIPKPFSPSQIKAVIDRASSNIHIVEKPAKLYENNDFNIVTEDSRMLGILEQMKLIAQSNSNVMIQGESGTGKELMARYIHLYSDRANGPFIAINCAALPEGVLESELFGHEKGSFTGAVSKRIGKIELAHGGTLLLDEISEMPKHFQPKLLRITQEREVVRVGGNQQVKVDVRFIATTNRNIMEEVNAGRFREDLFYRLCVMPVFVPPLRERKGDISILTYYFANKVSKKLGRRTPEVSSEVMDKLMNHDWPGNVRELENVIERAVGLSSDCSILSDLLITNREKLSSYAAFDSGMTLKDMEREIILRTLEEVNGNKEEAARRLGISAKTIRNKLYKYRENQSGQI